MWKLHYIYSFRYNRAMSLKEFRWEIGSVLPQDIKLNLSEQEVWMFIIIPKYLWEIWWIFVISSIECLPESPEPGFIPVSWILDFHSYFGCLYTRSRTCMQFWIQFIFFFLQATTSFSSKIKSFIKQLSAHFSTFQVRRYHQI